jgi:hypothetical protein
MIFIGVMRERELSRKDLMVVIHRVAEVTGCCEFVIGGRSALVMACASSALLCTQDFDIGITEEGTRRGINTFEAELGRGSAFAVEHGFYVEHAGAEMLTFVLPEGWRTRAVRVEAVGVVALCLAPVDVAINKLHAKRPKDLEHLVIMLREGIVSETQLRTAIQGSPYTFLIEAHLQTLAVVMRMAQDGWQ